MKTIVISLVLASFQLFAQPTHIFNVKGYTFNQNEKLQHFSSITFAEGKVLALDGEIPKDAILIDGQGKAMLPGLIDSHGHLLGLGNNLIKIDLRGVPTEAKTAKKVQDYAKQNPELSWVTGRGWNQVLWPSNRFPSRVTLDEYVKNRPVWLRRVDGHAGWANSKALEIAGITRDTLDPPGGKIIRDNQGNPTGVLIDTAMYLLEKHIPNDPNSSMSKALELAGKRLLSEGITSMHDAGIGFSTYNFFKKMAEQGKLPLRVYAMVSAGSGKLVEMLDAGYVKDERDFLSIRSVKAMGDGALGSRGAALIHAYTDAPDNRGLLVTSKERFKPLFDLVLSKGFQLNMHAIGDRTNRMALNQFADTFKRIGGQEQRHRIEHAQIVAVEDIPLFESLKVLPSMQPTHATSDMNMAQDRVGKDRLKGAYAWQTFLKQGTRVPFGSDFPVELSNPFFGIHAAVTRQDRKNQPKKGWIPEQAVSVAQALKGFTWDAAYAAHQENIIGGLSKGKWADFILIDQDIFTIRAQDIWKTKVLQTWIAGERVY